LNDPKEFDVIDFDLLVKSYSKQTESMDVEIIEYIIEKLVEDLRREYDRTRSLSDLIFSKVNGRTRDL